MDEQQRGIIFSTIEHLKPIGLPIMVIGMGENITHDIAVDMETIVPLVCDNFPENNERSLSKTIIDAYEKEHLLQKKGGGFAIILGSGLGSTKLGELFEKFEDVVSLQTQSIPIFNSYEDCFDDCRSIYDFYEEGYKIRDRKDAKEMVEHLSRNFVSKFKPSRHTHPVRRVKIPKK